MGTSTQRMIELEDSVAVELAGDYDSVLRSLEDRLGLEIHLRGNRVTLTGAEDRVASAAAVIEEISALVASGRPLGPDTVDAVAAAVAVDASAGDLLGDVVWRSGQRVVTPRTPGQKRYVDAIRSSAITFGVGPAGTGKTYLAVALAVAALSRREVGRIILTRPAVEAGENLGFLPGDLAEKVDPYLRPLFDAMYDLLDPERVQAMLERGQVELAPIAFMRGRSLHDSFVILDEAQNTTPEQMKMFLTRLGMGSRMVVNGDITQIDLPPGRSSGLVVAPEILRGLKDVAFVSFGSDDVVRHRLVQAIVEAYQRYERDGREGPGR